MPIGARVTLRGDRMWEFLDRLINIALPRVRDFRGVRPKAFDGRGNYTLGVRDHFIFPEIDYAKTDKSKGLNVTIVTTAGRDDRAGPARRAGHALREVTGFSEGPGGPPNPRERGTMRSPEPQGERAGKRRRWQLERCESRRGANAEVLDP